MSNRKDHGLKQHGLSDDAVEAGHDFIHDAEVEEERVSGPRSQLPREMDGDNNIALHRDTVETRTRCPRWPRSRRKA